MSSKTGKPFTSRTTALERYERDVSDLPQRSSLEYKQGLAHQILEGDEQEKVAARNELVQLYLKTIVQSVKKYAKKHSLLETEVEDLIQEANLFLIQKVRRLSSNDTDFIQFYITVHQFIRERMPDASLQDQETFFPVHERVDKLDPEVLLLQSETRRNVSDLSEVLPRKEREVIQKRFGLTGEESMRLQEIGDTMDLSRERVRQIESQAIARLKRKVRLLSPPSRRTDGMEDLETIQSSLLKEGLGYFSTDTLRAILRYYQTNYPLSARRLAGKDGEMVEQYSPELVEILRKNLAQIKIDQGWRTREALIRGKPIEEQYLALQFLDQYETDHPDSCIRTAGETTWLFPPSVKGELKNYLEFKRK